MTLRILISIGPLPTSRVPYYYVSRITYARKYIQAIRNELPNEWYQYNDFSFMVSFDVVTNDINFEHVLMNFALWWNQLKIYIYKSNESPAAHVNALICYSPEFVWHWFLRIIVTSIVMSIKEPNWWKWAKEPHSFKTFAYIWKRSAIRIGKTLINR